HIDKLFDILNIGSVTSQNPKKFRDALTSDQAPGKAKKCKEQIEFPRTMLASISTRRFETRRQPHTVKGWQITISAVLLLWEDLHLNFGFSQLFTRRLNQDVLENLFGMCQQQHGCNETPNAFQFVRGLKHILVGKLFKISGQSNCEADRSVILTKLKKLPVPRCQAAAAHSEQQAEYLFGDLETESESQLTDSEMVIQANVRYYVAGNLVHRFMQKKLCAACSDTLKSSDESFRSKEQFLALLSAGIALSNATPLQACLELVNVLEERFLTCISKVLHQDGGARSLHAYLMQCAEDPFCSLACKVQFIKMFTCTRLLWHLHLLNRGLSKRSAEARKAAKL
ncbi:hypothetical protein HPB47_005268, partial [Ixodes persulcatus]